MNKENKVESFTSTEKSSDRLIQETRTLLTNLNKIECERMRNQQLTETEYLELLIKLEQKELELTEMKEKLRRLVKSKTRKRKKAAQRFDKLAEEVQDELKEAKEEKTVIERCLNVMLDPKINKELGKGKPYNQTVEDQKKEILESMKDLHINAVEEVKTLNEETGLIQQDKEERDKECEEAIQDAKRRSQMVKLLCTRVKETLERLRRRNPAKVVAPPMGLKNSVDVAKLISCVPSYKAKPAVCAIRSASGGCCKGH
ncbi:hypothetical protein QAD02_010794 [Eretmocerus hayati]|uniref:Uncharacterized protein n=1 Tax=Eretmocerus hayati TaxID=131215 RepID=A0ACC2NUX6_9HYME|nr:hypothetical protein QAD02_010794 [Eretmocerus hayati]